MWKICNILFAYYYQQFMVCDHADLTAEAVVMKYFLDHVVCQMLSFLCCYSEPLHLSSFYMYMKLATVLYCQMLHSLGTTFHPSLADGFLPDVYLMCLFPDITVPSHCRMQWLHSFLIRFLALSYRFCYVFFHIHSHFDDVSFLSGLITL